MLINSLPLLHPAAREQFELLAARLHDDFLEGVTKTPFEPFETYRDPQRQAALFLKGDTRAAAWYSAHQYGLAVDFVPRPSGKWSWAAGWDWDHLRLRSREHDLVNEIAWDRPHVQHPLWPKLFAVMKG